MNEDVQRAYEELRDYGTATVMVVRADEMPAIVLGASQGDADAQMRLAAVQNILPAIETGKKNCVFCNQPQIVSTVSVLVFVSRQIHPGADALWTSVCLKCDEPDPQKLTSKILTALGFKRILHEAGHA